MTASGKIEPKTSVDISADITGRIIRIAVREGDTVRKGQFLIQIDPAEYQAAVTRAEAIVASTQATLLQTRANRDQAEREWRRTNQLTQLGPNLIAPATAEQARTTFDVAEATYQSTRAQLQESRANLQAAKDNLAKTRLVSPISGRVVRLAVEEGEVAVPGTFSRETGLLMTVADLSVILAKVQVDETDVVRIAGNDSVQITIDAYPDTTFVGRVTKVSHSAKLTPDADGLRIERPRRGLRRGGAAGRPSAGHPAGPELHRPDRHRHPRARAQHSHHRAHRPGPRAGAQRERPSGRHDPAPPAAEGGGGRIRRARQCRRPSGR